MILRKQKARVPQMEIPSFLFTENHFDSDYFE